MRWPSPAPGASRRRCSAARTSASTRSMSACEPRLRAVLDLVSLAVFAFFIALVTWHAWGVVLAVLVSNSHSLSEIEAPLVIPQALWFAGLVFFVAVGAAAAGARAVAPCCAATCPALFALIGSKSAVAEAEEEVAARRAGHRAGAEAMTAGVSLDRAAVRARQLDRRRRRHGPDRRDPEPASTRSMPLHARRWASSPGRPPATSS